MSGERTAMLRLLAYVALTVGMRSGWAELASPADENYYRALRVYNELLAEEEKAPLRNLLARIEANERLVRRYTADLQELEQRLAELRTEHERRVSALERAVQDSEISKETFARLLEKEKAQFGRKEDEHQQDATLFRQEIAAAKERLAELRAERAELAAVIPRSPAPDVSDPEPETDEADPEEPPAKVANHRSTRRASKHHSLAHGPAAPAMATSGRRAIPDLPTLLPRDVLHCFDRCGYCLANIRH